MKFLRCTIFGISQNGFDRLIKIVVVVVVALCDFSAVQS